MKKIVIFLGAIFVVTLALTGCTKKTSKTAVTTDTPPPPPAASAIPEDATK